MHDVAEFGPNEPFIHGDLIDIHGVWLGDYDPDGLTPPFYVARALEVDMVAEYESLKAQGVPLPATNIGFGAHHFRRYFDPDKLPYDIDDPEACLRRWFGLGREMLLFWDNVNVRWSSLWKVMGKDQPWGKVESWLYKHHPDHMDDILAMMERSRVFYRQRHS